METMNKQLKELYESKWKKLKPALLKLNNERKLNKEKKIDEPKVAHPLLIQVDDSYKEADIKVMFFGQNALRWLGQVDKKSSVEECLSMYNRFYNGNMCQGYGGPFWNFIKKLKEDVSNSKKNKNKKVEYVWNNVLKIDEEGEPKDGIIETTFEHFNVIAEEIRILDPDVLIFLSGYTYDKHIEKTMGKFTHKTIDGFTEKQLCQLVFAKDPKIKAYRTYHPGGFRSIRIPGFRDIILDRLISTIRK